MSKLSNTEINEILGYKDEILSGNMSLRQVGEKIGRDHETLRRHLGKGLTQKEKEKLDEIMRQNKKNKRNQITRQVRKKEERRIKGKKTIKTKEFEKLEKEKKLEWIYIKINKKRIDRITSMETIKGKLALFTEYFCQNRNGGEIVFDENVIMRMMYQNPTMINNGLEKLICMFSFLDKDKQIGFDNANKIIATHPAILNSDVEKLKLKIELAKDINVLDKMIDHPANFIPGRQHIYALTMFALHDRKLSEKEVQQIKGSQLFLSEDKLKETYHISYEKVYKRYPLPDKYMTFKEQLNVRDSTDNNQQLKGIKKERKGNNFEGNKAENEIE